MAHPSEPPGPEPSALPRLAAPAEPRRFLEANGRRVALLGREDGVFECWMWPLCLFERFQLAFRTPGRREAILGSGLAARVEVTPAGLELVYVHPEFTLRQEVFAALDARALVVLLHLEGSVPVEVEARLVAAMRPQWPAGLGGAIAARDAETGALLLTEELGRFAALVGGPLADPVHLEADHALAKEPVAIVLRLEPGAEEPGVLVVAGAQVTPPPLSDAARRGEAEAARGFSRADAAVLAARELWRATSAGWRELRAEVHAHWQAWVARAPRAGGVFAEPLLWAQAAIERAWVEVDGVGKGLVAGLAPADGTSRPGFGWIFDGDALSAARALAACGDFASVREILRLAAGRQREDGKLMHELVLSAGLCRWTEDYPYAFYKAGNTPALVAVLDHYVEASGDRELARELWPSVVRAITWCARCTDERGLLANTKAGLAAVEAGTLVGRIQAEAYLNGIWLSSLEGGERLARALREDAFAGRCSELLANARTGFEAFWSEERGRYGFALLTDGSRCDDLAAYTAHPLSRGHGDPGRARRTAAQLNHPELTAAWGARMFSTRSSVYDPANYNTGSVFPYLTNFVCLALYEHGDPMAARQVLDGMLALHGFSGLGFVPEHLRGDRAVAPARGVPHQIFSSAGLIQSFVYGLWGARVRGGRGLSLAPCALPGAESAYLFRVGEAMLLATWRPSSPEQLDSWELLLSNATTSRHPVELDVRPRFPNGSQRIEAVDPLQSVRGKAPAALQPGQVWLRTWKLEPGPAAVFPAAPLLEGAPDTALRLLETHASGRRVTWRVAGRAGTEHTLPFWPGRARRTHGAELREEPPPSFDGDAAQSLRIRLAAGAGFVEHEIVFDLA